MAPNVAVRWLIAPALAMSVPLAAQTLTIKIGTVAPERTSWIAELKSMDQAWRKATEQRVRLRVMPPWDGEVAIITDMGYGNLDGAALSVVGLARIDPAFNVLGIPFFFESDAEAIHVLEKLTPHLSERLRAKNYQLILWGHAGWVQIFSKQRIQNMEELKRARLYTSEGNPDTVQWYRTNGFNAVPLSESQIANQLRLASGAINATPNITTLALLFYRDAPFMLEVRVAPLLAGVIVRTAVWNQISADDRGRMLAIAKKTEHTIFARAPQQDKSNLEVMTKDRLQVTHLTQAQMAEFRAAADRLTATQRGSLIDKDLYDWAVRERDAFRKSRASK